MQKLLLALLCVPTSLSASTYTYNLTNIDQQNDMPIAANIVVSDSNNDGVIELSEVSDFSLSVGWGYAGPSTFHFTAIALSLTSFNLDLANGAFAPIFSVGASVQVQGGDGTGAIRSDGSSLLLSYNSCTDFVFGKGCNPIFGYHTIGDIPIAFEASRTSIGGSLNQTILSSMPLPGSGFLLLSALGAGAFFRRRKTT